MKSRHSGSAKRPVVAIHWPVSEPSSGILAVIAAARTGDPSPLATLLRERPDLALNDVEAAELRSYRANPQRPAHRPRTAPQIIGRAIAWCRLLDLLPAQQRRRLEKGLKRELAQILGVSLRTVEAAFAKARTLQRRV